MPNVSLIDRRLHSLSTDISQLISARHTELEKAERHWLIVGLKKELGGSVITTLAEAAILAPCVCRIVITTLKGAFVDHIGGNGAQLRDGSFQEAAFSRPQGLAFSQRRNALYIADTENHALRKVPHQQAYSYNVVDFGC